MLNLLRAQDAGFISDVNVSHTQMQNHMETTAIFFIPEEGLCRRFAAPL